MVVGGLVGGKNCSINQLTALLPPTHTTATDVEQKILFQPWCKAITASSPAPKQRFKLLVERLHKCLDGYDDYLDGKAGQVAAMHLQTEGRKRGEEMLAEAKRLAEEGDEGGKWYCARSCGKKKKVDN